MTKYWPLIDRGDGRIEILDPKGCGHVSERLSKLLYPKHWKEWMNTHGCSGLCGSKEWRESEDFHFARLTKAIEKSKESKESA